MSAESIAFVVLAYLLTYALHSTLLLSLAWLANARLRIRSHRLREGLWKLALLGGLLTASVQLATGWEPYGGLWSLGASPGTVARVELAPAGETAATDGSAPATLDWVDAPLVLRSDGDGASVPTPAEVTARYVFETRPQASGDASGDTSLAWLVTGDRTSAAAGGEARAGTGDVEPTFLPSLDGCLGETVGAPSEPVRADVRLAAADLDDLPADARAALFLTAEPPSAGESVADDHLVRSPAHRIRTVVAVREDGPAGTDVALRPAPDGRHTFTGTLGPPQTWTAAGQGPPAWLAGLLLALWLAGAARGSIALALSRRHLRDRLRSRLELKRGPLPALLERLRRDAGVRRPVRLTCSPSLATPISLGLLRPEICVPLRAVTELDAGEQESMLAHELAHVVRRDAAWLHVYQWLARLFFFQPLNRLAKRRIQDSTECICDDWAVARTGQSLALARCLTRVAGWVVARPALPAPCMAQSSAPLTQRVERLLSTDRPSGEGRTIGLTACAGGLLAAVAVGAPGVSAFDAEREVAVAHEVELRFELLPADRNVEEIGGETLEELGSAGAPPPSGHGVFVHRLAGRTVDGAPENIELHLGVAQAPVGGTEHAPEVRRFAALVHAPELRALAPLDATAAASAAPADPADPASPVPSPSDLIHAFARLDAEVTLLEGELSSLRAELADQRVPGDVREALTAIEDTLEGLRQRRTELRERLADEGHVGAVSVGPLP